MTNKQERMWVDPGFKKRLKQMALDSDKKLMELTRDLAGIPNIEEKIKPKRVIRHGWTGPPF